MSDAATYSSAQPLTLERIVVRDGRVEAIVCIKDARYKATDQALIDACLMQHPSLPEHACKNPCGTTFAAVMSRTTTPHLLEHLVIDIQARALQAQREDEDGCFVGTTDFLADDPLRARVAVSYYDDLVCLAAFKEACVFLNECLSRC